MHYREGFFEKTNNMFCKPMISDLSEDGSLVNNYKRKHANLKMLHFATTQIWFVIRVALSHTDHFLSIDSLLDIIFNTSSVFQYSYNLARCDISWRRHEYRRSIKNIILYTADKFFAFSSYEKFRWIFRARDESHVGFEPNFHHKIELKNLKIFRKKFRVKLFTDIAVLC